MRSFRIAVWVGALAAAAVGGSPLQAAWNNVFQVCCHACQSPSTGTAYYYAPPTTAYYYAPPTTAYYYAPPVTAYYADPCCPQPCPQQVCTTRYVQRSYYQPVTCYENRTQYEAVTTYRTSYYWEPVCSYRVSCYYDPCSCSYQQVSVPLTSYRLRSQCSPVQNWVARCVSVPVTTQQLVTYYEPVTTCNNTAVAPSCTPPCPPATPPAAATPPPRAGVDVESTPPPPTNGTRGTNPSSSNKMLESPMPPAPPTGYRQYPPPANPAPAPVPPPAVRLDRIVAVPSYNVEGEVVRADLTAEAGARLVFQRADRPEERKTFSADNTGRFQATLAVGVWEVYTRDRAGFLVAHPRIQVDDSQTRQVRLTRR